MYAVFYVWICFTFMGLTSLQGFFYQRYCFITFYFFFINSRSLLWLILSKQLEIFAEITDLTLRKFLSTQLRADKQLLFGLDACEYFKNVGSKISFNKLDKIFRTIWSHVEAKVRGRLSCRPIFGISIFLHNLYSNLPACSCFDSSFIKSKVSSSCVSFESVLLWLAYLDFIDS